MNANLIIVRKSKHLNPNSRNIDLHYSTLLLNFERQKVCKNILKFPLWHSVFKTWIKVVIKSHNKNKQKTMAMFKMEIFTSDELHVF